MMGLPRQCQYCKDLFEPTPRASDFCCLNCIDKNEHVNVSQKRFCDTCGAPFVEAAECERYYCSDFCLETGNRMQHGLRAIKALMDIAAGSENIQCVRSEMGEVADCTGDLCVACEASDRVALYREAYRALHYEIRQLKKRVDELLKLSPEPR